ncbi:MAG: hypothetical protein HWD58_12725 [Bacteroidota bacterium]|nr:MAG: hypothetical protein HWD58_12725 [Bacteroidota bacterium]
MKHRYSFVLLSICSFLVQSLRATPGQLDFVENKKQWPEQIQFKTDIPEVISSLPAIDSGFRFMTSLIWNLFMKNDMKIMGRLTTCL